MRATTSVVSTPGHQHCTLAIALLRWPRRANFIYKPQSTNHNLQSTIYNLHCAMCDRQSTIHVVQSACDPQCMHSHGIAKSLSIH